jgi:hypothetical protein
MQLQCISTAKSILVRCRRNTHMHGTGETRTCTGQEKHAHARDRRNTHMHRTGETRTCTGQEKHAHARDRRNTHMHGTGETRTCTGQEKHAHARDRRNTHAQFPQKAIPSTKVSSLDVLVHMPEVMHCQGKASWCSPEHGLLCALCKLSLGRLALLALWRLISSTVFSSLRTKHQYVAASKDGNIVDGMQLRGLPTSSEDCLQTAVQLPIRT